MRRNGREAEAASGSSAAMPRVVWVLGLASLLMDISSEMIHAVLPLFLVQVLAADMLTVGFFEGIAESTALAVKLLSGVAADRFGHKKAWVLLGYGLAAAMKPVFAAADALWQVFVARFLDRVGKGLRGAPRDAILADATPPEMLSAAFGLRHSLDAAGAFIGPAIAALLLWRLAGSSSTAGAENAAVFETIFSISFIPGALCVAILYWGIQEPAPAGENEYSTKATASNERQAAPRAPLAIKLLFVRVIFSAEKKAFRAVLLLGFLAAFSRFATASVAFVALRASEAVFANAWIPIALAGMNFVFSVSSYPLSRLSAHLDDTKRLVVGFLLLGAAEAAFAVPDSKAFVIVGIVFLGLHLGAVQGALSALVARTSAQAWRASAFGAFSVLSSVGTFAAGLLAGALWDRVGAEMSFAAGAAMAIVAAVVALGLGPSLSRVQAEQKA